MPAAELVEVARWEKRAVMGKGSDALVLLEDGRGRTLIRRRAYKGVAFATVTIPTGDSARRFSDRPTLAEAEAFAAVNGYERRTR